MTCGFASLFKVYFHSHARAVGGIVVDVGNALYSLILDKLRDALDKSCLVHLIRQLRNDNFKSAVLFVFDNFGARSERYLASARCISGAYACSAHYDAGRRKIGTLLCAP